MDIMKSVYAFAGTYSPDQDHALRVLYGLHSFYHLRLGDSRVECLNTKRTFRCRYSMVNGIRTISMGSYGYSKIKK